MRLISNSKLRGFAAQHPPADSPLQAWRRIIEKNHFATFADLKRSFNSVDRVGDLYVFNISGNKYRLIALIQFRKQIVYIRHVLTHKEYDKGGWKS